MVEKSQGKSTISSQELLNVEQAAKILGVHQVTIRNYIQAGHLKAYRLGGQRLIRIKREDLKDLLEPISGGKGGDQVTQKGALSYP